MTPWNEFEKIEHAGDGSNDYYDGLMRNLADGDREMRTSRLSSFWGGRNHESLAESEATAHNLIRIRNAVRSFLRVHGLPNDAHVDLATIGQQAHGRCSFGDQEKWKRPLILLDKAIYKSCDTYNEALDVYCGIGLHEASHANHTRLLFELQKSGEVEGLRAIFAGLFEDERIEELARQESPGFAPYIQAAKRALFEKKEFGVAMAGWDDAVDMDKLTMLVFAFLRCPHLVKEQHTHFTLIDDSCPWEDLRGMFTDLPKTERKVQKDSATLYAYYLTKKKLYRDYADQLGSTDTEHPTGAMEKMAGDSEKLDRITKQSEASAADVEAIQKREKLSSEETKSIEAARVGDMSPEQLADELLTEQGGGIDKLVNILDERLEDVKDKRDKLEGEREGRFAALDLQEMMRRTNTVTEALDSQESRNLFSAEDQRLTYGDVWESEGSTLQRKDIVAHPKPDCKVYADYFKMVKNEIARMRNVFKLRLGTRTFRDTERKNGRLHRRRLARCQSTDRLFYRKSEKTDKGLALCLLLDESGSMGTPSIRTPRRKATITIQIAVLLAEALKKVPGIELEIYSYSSFGYNSEGSLLKYLYGKQNPNPQSIAAYGDGGENYDHKAIETSVELFKKNTTNKNRLMIMVSDGAPAGVEYGGHSAILATKRAADEAERKGVPIIHVAIEAYRAEEMFKNSLKFTDLSDLTNQMRRLVTKIVKRVSE